MYFNQSSDEYDRVKLACDGLKTLRSSEKVLNTDSYRAVVFVSAEYAPPETPEGEFIRGLALGQGPESAYNCGNVIPPRFTVVSAQHPYGTYAHELGHGLFFWGDYYSASNVDGQVYTFGVMGEGARNEEHPSQVMSYHKIEEGWIEQYILPSPYDETTTSTRKLDYLSTGGNATKLITAGDIFEHYLFEARTSSSTPVPLQNASYMHAGNRGDGVAMYGVVTTTFEGLTDYDDVHKVDNPNPNVFRDGDTVTLRAGTNDTVRDPDASVLITAEHTQGGAAVNVTHYEAKSKQGVNVYTLVQCEDVQGATQQECDRLTPGIGETRVVQNISVRAVTDSGVVGRLPNGTEVNTVSGGTFLHAGAVRKVYIPRNGSGSFVVDTSNLSSDATVTVVTQTVTRDKHGNRTASGFETRNISAGGTFEPELARLNVSRHRWNAGQLRTLEGNSVNIRVENNGIRSLANVTVESGSDWLILNRTDLGTIGDASSIPIKARLNVPGGTPVGNYTFNITVSGAGTRSIQQERIEVTVEVLPTVYWEATPASANEAFARTNSTTVSVTVTNSDASNVPLHDVESTITGNVTRFDVDSPRFVGRIRPGQSVKLNTTISVPTDGIREGDYHGTIDITPMQHYQQYYEFPIEVPASYVVPDPSSHATGVTIDARGPSVNSTATFHPKRQVAMRKGATTERVTVDIVDSEYDVPARSLKVRATIPDGWTYPSGASGETDGSLSVWVVRENGDTPAGKAGERTRLSPSSYQVNVTEERVLLTIDDIRSTNFSRYMSSEHALEIEFKLNKNPKASRYEYTSEIDVLTASPQAVFRLEDPAPSVDVFDPRPDNVSRTISNSRQRVEQGHIRFDTASLGTNATLRNTKTFIVPRNGEDQAWLRFTIVDNATGTAEYLWVRETVFTKSQTYAISDNGYLLVEARHTRNSKGAISSRLRNSKSVTLELPVTTQFENRSAVTIASTTIVDADNGTAVTFLAGDDTPVVWLNGTVDNRTAWSADGGVPITTGRGVFERQTNSSAAKRITRPEHNVMAPVISIKGGR